MAQALAWREDWPLNAAEMREMAEALRSIAEDFNLDKERCTCGEAERFADMTQRVLHAQVMGVAEKLMLISEKIDRGYEKFVPRKADCCPFHKSGGGRSLSCGGDTL